MPDKLSQLRRLIGEGFSVIGVDSDDECVKATLRRSTQVVTLRLHRADAAKLLFSDPLRPYR